MNPSTEIARHRVFVHRRNARLIEIVAPPGSMYRQSSTGLLSTLPADRVMVIRVTSSGMPAKSARVSTMALPTFERDFLAYRPCRWLLTCDAQAASTVTWEHRDHEIDACARHTAEHAAWEMSTDRDPYHEPGPDCWCTDSDIEYGEVQDYCPDHGTGPGRGVDMSVVQLGIDPTQPLDPIRPA